MKKVLRISIIILCAILVLGLGVYTVKQKEFPTVEFIVPGNDETKEGITAIGEYMIEEDPAPDHVAAKIGDSVLTNGQLQVYYWAQVAAHRQTDQSQPDLRVPLSWQACPLDESVDSWEQYFLNRALESWHGAQALMLQGNDEGLPLEERYEPIEKFHEKYLTNKPATALLYGYNDGYQLNTLHAKYIDGLSELFDSMAAEMGYADGEELARAEFGTTEEALCQAAAVYNRGYSYYTALTYLLETEEPEGKRDEDEEPCVSFRQVLLIPEQPKLNPKKKITEPIVPYEISDEGKVSCMESGWTKCEKNAKNMLKSFKSDFLRSEYQFGQLAFTNSKDEGSWKNGGYYGNVVRGQVPAVLEGWLFDAKRKAGDTTVIRSEYGVHILYFSEGSTIERNAEIDAGTAKQQLALIETAKEKYPMEVDYTAIRLQGGNGTVTFEDFLYEDIAHERYPEVPLYLQRDYGRTMYGAYPLSTHGCGITSLAMLATYLTDEEWTPPTLCDMFGSYCGRHGSDVRLFWQAPSKLGYYFKEYVYKDDEAWQALQDGYLVVAKEIKGYWTGGGHYIVLEKLTEDEQVVVRDSNIFNFGKLEGHDVDYFSWDKVTGQAVVYFVFGKKPTHIDACVRCGDPGMKTVEMIGDSYICPNCDTAMLRRDTYLLGTV